MQKKLLVIGGGAAGFFCAVNAAALSKNLKVVIAEKSSKLLSKVKISGGGRCNVTHACFDIEEMIEKYPRGKYFLRKAFHHFFTTNTIDWFKQKGVPLKTESDGRMFPQSNTSQTIINCLLNEAAKHQVDILMNHEIDGIELMNNTWKAHFKNNKIIEADFVCIACGGFSKPEMYDWIIKTGHRIEPPVPSLFSFNIHDEITALQGISVQDASIKILETNFQSKGALLITHWGLSGPAILKLSAFAARELSAMHYQFSIRINWLHNVNEQSLKNTFQKFRIDMAKKNVATANPFHLPLRLWQYLVHKAEINSDCRFADLSSKHLQQLINLLCAQTFLVKGKTTFKDEFVTAGGIQLNEINAASMESKIQPNLFFAGEIIDVDGITGGYNFQNAWTTAWIAANAIAQKTKNPQP